MICNGPLGRQFLGLSGSPRGADTTGDPHAVCNQRMFSTRLKPARRLNLSIIQSKGVDASIPSSKSNSAVGGSLTSLAPSPPLQGARQQSLQKPYRQAKSFEHHPHGRRAQPSLFGHKGLLPVEDGGVVAGSSKSAIPFSSDSSNSLHFFYERKQTREIVSQHKSQQNHAKDVKVEQKPSSSW